MRLYGMAYTGERPYEIRICVACAHLSSGGSQKVADALDELERRREELAE